MAQHCLHLYTGEGKGKTSAAMGLALRMLGHGKKVVIAQFMKDGTSGEIKALTSFENVLHFEGGRMKGFAFRMTPSQLEAMQEEQGAAARELTSLIGREQPDLTILDELCVALAMNLVKKDDAYALIDAALQTGEVAVTGRYATEEMIAKADYVSRLDAVKHPFDEGQPARKGVEF